MLVAGLNGLLYFGIVFAFAFATGVARTLVVAPRLGPTVAVFLEVPILIAASWVVAYYLLRNRSFSMTQRVVMGLTAFTLTMASEAELSLLMRGQDFADWARTLQSPLGLVGLTAQIVFAALPIFVRRT
jgi:hypothetical protein